MATINRRGLLQSAGAALVAPYLWVPARAQEAAWATQTLAPFVEVETASGRIRGGHSRGALAFKAIPYAGSVSGKNRFKAAPKVTPWAGVRDATLLGPPALQAPGGTYGEHEPPYSEDCLVLNVWTPATDGAKRPVMVYCHGGGFTSGSGGQKTQDGSRLAATYDVVVVALNHRLGLFGYLYLGDLAGDEYAASGNQSHLDIVAALAWVKDNIARFGGDPGNVMLFGESGGGFKTSALLAMPAAQGLIHKAAIQSGSMLRGLTKEVATETTLRVLAGLGLGPKDARKLVDIPAQQLLAIQFGGDNAPLAVPTKDWRARHPGSSSQGRAEPGSWGPVVDGTFLPVNPFDPVAPAISASVPLLLGNCRDEAIFFEREHPDFFKADEAALAEKAHKALGSIADRVLTLYRQTRPQASPVERAIAIETALLFGNDTAMAADLKSRQPAPVYRYRYDYASNTPIPGTDWTYRAAHAGDIAMVFYNYEFKDLQGTAQGIAEASKAMSGYFTSFARSAVPSAAGQPAWPRYDTATRATMLINTQCHVADDPDSQERQFWQSLPKG